MRRVKEWCFGRGERREKLKLNHQGKERAKRAYEAFQVTRLEVGCDVASTMRTHHT